MPPTTSITKVALLASDRPLIRAHVREAAHGLCELHEIALDLRRFEAVPRGSWNALFVDFAEPTLGVAAELAVVARYAALGRPVIGIGSTRSQLVNATLSTDLTDLIPLDEPAPWSLARAHLLDATTRGARAIALRLLRQALPPEFGPLVSAVMLAPDLGLTLDSLGRRVHVPRKAIHQDTTAALGLTAGEFVDWCRVVLVSAILEHTDLKVAVASEAVGFIEVGALRGRVREFLGRQLRDLHGNGSAVEAAELLARRVREWSSRHRPHQPRSYRTPRTPV